MPWRTLCGFPPTADTVVLRIPNGAWRPDTVITDDEGNEMFVLLDQTNQMRSYEAVFGDLEGRRLVCVKRHLMATPWSDGYYFCTYRPNYRKQKSLSERDVDGKKLYPFAYLEIMAMKGRFYYRHFDDRQMLRPPRMWGENPWMGFMMVCCTMVIRCGKWTLQYRKGAYPEVRININQWKNRVEVGPGNDLLAALCMAYVFDKCQAQPMITVVGRDEDDEYIVEEESLDSEEEEEEEEEEDEETKKKREKLMRKIADLPEEEQQRKIKKFEKKQRKLKRKLEKLEGKDDKKKNKKNKNKKKKNKKKKDEDEEKKGCCNGCWPFGKKKGNPETTKEEQIKQEQQGLKDEFREEDEYDEDDDDENEDRNKVEMTQQPQTQQPAAPLEQQQQQPPPPQKSRGWFGRPKQDPPQKPFSEVLGPAPGEII